MTFIEILKAKDNTEFEMVEPNCSPTSIAYSNWKGLKVVKVLGAVVVTNSAGVKTVENGDFVPACGLVISSEWRRI